MNIVTGAFGYIGRYITKLLLESGGLVRTITTHPGKTNPFGERVQAYPYHFEEPDMLIRCLEGAQVLFNTYWIRFEYDGRTFNNALQNTRLLFSCAKAAGIKRVVHISVTNASLDSTLPYYSGKAQQEQLLIDSGLSYAIIRPTLVFGIEDILVNNIAWLIRKFPVFPIFGDGKYRLQPIFAGDLAEIAVTQSKNGDDIILDAIGPEIFTFENFVGTIVSQIKPGVRLIKSPPWMGIFLGEVIGRYLRDVILTRDELDGLMEEMLTSTQSPNGRTAFTHWLSQNKDRIGIRYASELNRHFNWTSNRESTR